MISRSACCLILLAVTLAGVETDPRAQVKAVWTEAGRVGDLWTCLQAEEWGRAQKPAIKLGPVLGGVVAAGSTLLALPERIQQCTDLGERVVMSTRRRVWVVAPDGRPLQRSLPLTVVSGTQALGFGCRVVASAALPWQESGPSTLRVGVQPIEEVPAKGVKGILSLQYEHAFEHGIRMVGNLVVADDGSAVALDLDSDGAGGAFGRQVLVTVGRGQEMVKNAWNPSAVGRGGTWVVVNGEGGRELVRGQRREHLDKWAFGPGMAAVFTERSLKLILADGSDKIIDHGLALGTDYGLASVGGWLIFDTGYGAKAQSDGDLLSAGKADDIQPSTLLLWRWADLAADPAARPVATLPGRLSVAGNHPAGLVLWSDRTIELLDLSGREPQRSAWKTAPRPVNWAYVEGHALVVSMGDGLHAVYGPDGAELWSGTVNGLTIKRHDLALTRRAGEKEGSVIWQLQQISVDPGKRSETTLELPHRDMGIQVGFRGFDWVIGNIDGRWMRLGLDGKLMDQGEENQPSTEQWNTYHHGRFYCDGSRAIAKALPQDENHEQLFLQDAWRFGAVTMLLDDDGRVRVSGKKRGEFIGVGVIANADRFAMAVKTPVVVSAKDNAAVAILASGFKALAPGPAELPKFEELPPGPWRLEGSMIYSIPNSKRLRWDSERTGFEPRRLRSPEGAGLFVITPSALLELDPDAAKMVGVTAN